MIGSGGDSVVRRIREAREDRDAHAEACVAWDYEGSDCSECTYHDEVLRAAKAQYRRLVSK